MVARWTTLGSEQEETQHRGFDPPNNELILESLHANECGHRNTVLQKKKLA